MGGTGPQLAQRLRKYTTGTFAGIFSQQSNIDINNPMVVFNIRDLEDELRPVAMYIVLNYIWNKTKTDQKTPHADCRRGLAADEVRGLGQLLCLAWPSGPVSTTWESPPLPRTSKTLWAPDGPGDCGQRLYAVLAQASSSAVDVLADVFKLTSEERKRLSQFPVGQGLFFAGQNHVHIQIIASPTETA